MSLAPKSLQERFEDLYDAAKAKGLTDRAAQTYATLMIWGEQFGVSAAPIVSGKRSRIRNEILQAKWDLGFRDGLRVRPAEESAHLDGDAFDISAPANVLRGYGQLSRYLPGVRWGGTFATPDPVHFDLRG